jgi:hypothetical protein
MHTFTYSGPHGTRARAELQLESLFASGDICEGERPLIVRRKRGWYITLPLHADTLRAIEEALAWRT